MLNYTYSSLGTAGTVQAAAADAVVNDHLLTITGAPVVDVRQVEDFIVTAAVAGVAPSNVATPVLAASTDYSILVSQTVNGVLQQVVLTYQTPAAGGTVNMICNAWASQFNAVASRFNLTAAGGATFTLTGLATLPSRFTVTQVYPSTTAGTITFAPVAGTVPVNTYAVLAAQGITTIPALLAGQSYTSVQITYRTSSVAETAGDVTQSRSIHTVFINEGATNFAALNTRLGRIAAGLDPATGAVADPEFLSII
jgi:hypothetical protein